MSSQLHDIDRARRDPAVFAETLVGQALWPHQLEVVASPARYRMICAGRQVGKSRLLAVIALHQAFSVPGSVVLVVSAGDTAAKRLLEEVVTLATASPLLRGAVVDDTQSTLVLSNGSTVRSVPASQRQIRGWAVDLLIVDEAAFIDPEIWRAAEPAIIARPGSRVVLCSSPWGAADHFFRVLWSQGMNAAGVMYEGWHWPSSTSPLVDDVLLGEIRSRESPLYFAREYLAEWVDETGSYFTTAELAAAVDDFELVNPDDQVTAYAAGWVVGGVDWGGRRDANALAVVGALAEVDERGRPMFWVPWLEERFDLSYEGWIDRLVAVCGAFAFQVLSSEENGVGQMPTQVLGRAMWEAGRPGVVSGVTTTARLKENAFGFMRLLFQQGRLRLPRHPALLKQLAALEYAMTESGLLRIAVPERAGHDDLAMSLALAVLPLMAGEMVPVTWGTVDMDDMDDEVANYAITQGY